MSESTQGKPARHEPDDNTIASLSLLLLDQQERWERGECPRAEVYLEKHPSLHEHSEDFLTLLYHELVLRERRGERPHAAEYEQRFPQFANDIRQQFEIHAALSLPAITANPAAGLPASLPAPPPGYEILSVLGRGGTAVVYQARQLALDRPVALKMILGGEDARPEDRARFRAEAQAVASLKHANIVQIHEVIEHDGRLFLALEYMDGGSLARQINGTPLPARLAADLVESLAQAMHFVHQKGLIHRDLKPANVLLQNADHRMPNDPAEPLSAICNLQSAIPKVSDFGLAKSLRGDSVSHTRTGDVLGTPSYMAPEQIDGPRERVGPATDVYGLGAILYELLTGRAPFVGASALATLQQVRDAEPVSPTHLSPGCPRDLATIVLKCLNKDPNRRYASAAALADDLRRFREGLPIAARPVSGREQLVKWARRRPAVATLLASLAAVTLLAMTGITWLWAEAEGERADALMARDQAKNERGDAIKARDQETKERGEAILARDLAKRERADAVRARDLEAIARGDAEASLYVSQISEAFLEWSASRRLRAEQILDACRAQAPNLCHWEWHYLKRQCQTHSLTLTGHTQYTNWLTYSPNGELLVSCGGYFNGTEPGEVKVWDARSGKLLHDLRGPARAVYRVAFHPQGEWLAAACLDGKIWRWNFKTPEQPDFFDCKLAVNALSFHPNGQSLAVGLSSGAVQVLDVTDWTIRHRFKDHYENVWEVAYSPDGKVLATASRDAMIIVRAADTGRLLYRLHNPANIRLLAFSPDSRLLASGSYDGRVKIWDLDADAAELVSHFLGTANVFGLTFSPDGRRLACATRTTGIRIWNVRGQYEELAVGTGAGTVRAVAFSADARCIAVAMEDNVIRVWDTQSRQDPATLWNNQQTWIHALAISPKTPVMALAGGLNWANPGARPMLRLVDAGGKLIGELKGHTSWLTSVAFRKDGEQLVSGDRHGFALLWRLGEQRLEHKLKHGAPVLSVAYRPDGTEVATAGADGCVRFWDSATGAEKGKLEHKAGVHAVAYSDDGRLIVSAGADRVVRVWEAAAGTEVYALRGHEACVNSVAFRPGSHLLASADEHYSLRFWDCDTGEERTARASTFAAGPPDDENPDDNRGPATPSEWRITCLAFSPDGRRLVLVGPMRPVQLWDVATRQPLLSLRSNVTNADLCATFSRDGKQLFVGYQNLLMVWDSAFPDVHARAEAVGKRPVAWHQEQLNAAQQDRNWFAFDFHATRLVEAGPAQAVLLARRGSARAALGQEFAALADHWAASVLAKDDPQIWMARGQACVSLKQWKTADQAFSMAVKLSPNSVAARYQQATARLGAGDLAGYKAACLEMLARFGATKSVAAASNVVYAVAPLADGDPEKMLRLAERAVVYFPGNERVLGAAFYRAGRYREATQQFATSAPRFRPKAWDLLFRAMAYTKLGEMSAADFFLKQARHWVVEADRAEAIPTQTSNARWLNWQEQIEVHALLREADKVVRAGP